MTPVATTEQSAAEVPAEAPPDGLAAAARLPVVRDDRPVAPAPADLRDRALPVPSVLARVGPGGRRDRVRVRVGPRAPAPGGVRPVLWLVGVRVRGVRLSVRVVRRLVGVRVRGVRLSVRVVRLSVRVVRRLVGVRVRGVRLSVTVVRRLVGVRVRGVRLSAIVVRRTGSAPHRAARVAARPAGDRPRAAVLLRAPAGPGGRPASAALGRSTAHARPRIVPPPAVRDPRTAARAPGPATARSGSGSTTHAVRSGVSWRGCRCPTTSTRATWTSRSASS
jgi:hypothetical protein